MEEDAMEIHSRPCRAKGVTLLSLDGGIDHTNSHEFVTRMDALLEEGKRFIVLDLERLTYAASWGLAAMVRVHHHYAARGGRVAFANLHGAVATLLQISHLDRLFDLYPTVREAVRNLTPKDAES